MKVLVTGAGGFIGQNLVVRLRELESIEVLTYTKGDPENSLLVGIKHADFIFHLAGENRPIDVDSFETVNVGLTRRICDLMRSAGRRIPLVFTSSIQATADNPYGNSKMSAENALKLFAQETGNQLAIYRLPGVFGKWCRPNYNSVVATFCHNIANDLPVEVHAPDKAIRLVYVDDVIDSFLRLLARFDAQILEPVIEPEYTVTLGDLREHIEAFKNCRSNLVSERVGSGLIRALYSTYLSYLPTEKFQYSLPIHGDARGVFVEMLKTPDSGQFSFFTAHPGITRGGHYHHTKTEKFLVIKGRALFRFRHILNDSVYSLETRAEMPQVVETIPGWTHDITNVGDGELIVMLWANEIFDRSRPDTIACKV